MTILNDTQEQLLVAVKKAYEEVTPVIKKMEEEFEHAVYRAKQPVRDAVDTATDSRVPMSRIVSEATDLKYAQKLINWLKPSEAVAARLEDNSEAVQLTEEFTEEIESITTVHRDPSSGEISVLYQGMTFSVPSLGPDTEPWTTKDENIPPGVYKLIEDKYPGFAVLDEDED